MDVSTRGELREKAAALYAQMKLLDDGGNKRTLEEWKILQESSVVSDMESVLGSLAVDAPAPISLNSYCSNGKLDKKFVLEQVLDRIFQHGAGSNKSNMVNFGLLLRDTALTLPEVSAFEDYLQNKTSVSVKDIQHEFLFTISEMELLLALVYSGLGVDEKTSLKEQYEKAAAHIQLPKLSKEIVEELTAEFDTALDDLQRQKREKREPAMAEMDRSIQENMAQTTDMCDSLLASMKEFSQSMEEYKDKIMNVDVVEIEEEIRDDGYFTQQHHQSSELSAANCGDPVVASPFLAPDFEVLPKLPRNVPGSSSTITTPTTGHFHHLPCSALPPNYSPAHYGPAPPPPPSTCSRTPSEIPLTREPTGALPPPAAGDYCLAKKGDEWVTAVFQQLSVDGLPVVKLGHTLATVVKEHIAYASPPSWYMPIGGRVVAQFGRKDAVGGSTMRWCSAVVAEQPSISRNKGRYLVFNEFGDARYVAYTDIRCCWRQPKSPTVWAEIANTSVRDFLKQLIANLPEKALVRLKPKGTVRLLAENGSWKKCLVDEVDGVMVKLRLPEGRSEWVYRGDRRLEPIFEQHVQASRSSIVRRQHSRFTGPVIEYVDDESDQDEDIEADASLDSDASSGGPRKLQTARKKTSGGGGGHSNRGSISSGSARIHQGGSSTHHSFARPAFLRPKEIVETYRRVLDTLVVGNRPKEASADAANSDASAVNDQRSSSSSTCCDVRCVGTTNEHPNKYKNENPLLIPLLCGWQRITETTRTRSKIYYVPPCDHRRLRQHKELQQFLVQTDCQLTIDLFDFDVELDPLETIRVIEPFVRIEDFTNGRENVRIECVNGVNMDKPIFPHYEAHRFSTDKDVDLNWAKLFKSCCDCTDNCADPKRCQCQQLTITQATPENKAGRRRTNKHIGYRYRRLTDGHVSTGIYECNQGCKCDHRCPNRVVQQPLMTRLQLFRTPAKGWGVRTLDDLPKGSFVCVYAGNLLSDKVANEIGRGQGDEYFADLDMILVAEKMKEGYEENVIEESSGSDADESTTSMGAKKRRVHHRPPSSNNSTSEDENTENSAMLSRAPRAGAPGHWSLSDYLGDDHLFTLDAKLSGNIGRYLNHSCAPNTFVQNVFVDTHDMRLPWVAFFASQLIKAGTELSWDYSYTPMDDRPMACHCGAPNCRKRLI